MHSSRLIKLLKTLEEEELKRLLKFLKSPFFNANPRIVQLYEYLRKYHPEYQSPKLQKEKVFAKLFPSRPFNYSKLTNLMSDFSQLVEEYLILLEYKQDQFQKQEMLAKAFGRRNAYDLFEKGTMKLLAELDEQPFRDIAYFEKAKRLLGSYFFHPLTKKYQTSVDYPEEMMDHLDLHFLLSKLQLSAELLSRQKYLSKKYEIKWLEESLKESEIISSEELPLLLVYSNLIRLMDQPETAQFYLVKQEFKTHLKKIPQSDQFFIFQQLLNYAIQQINRGVFTFNKEALELYKIGLSLGILMEKGQMTESTFSNIVSAASVLKEFDWAASFIDQYQGFLEEHIRESVCILSYAILSFRKGDYSKSIDLLQQYPFSMILHQLKARSYIVRCWYEEYLLNEEYYEFLMAQIDAFEKFLRRNEEVSTDRQAGFLNFIKILKRLVDYRIQNKTTAPFKEKLLKKLNDYNQIMMKRWLEEKIGEID